MHLRPTSPPGSPALSSYERISDTEVLFYKQLRPYFMAVIPSPIFIVIPFHIPFHITFPPPRDLENTMILSQNKCLLLWVVLQYTAMGPLSWCCPLMGGICGPVLVEVIFRDLLGFSLPSKFSNCLAQTSEVGSRATWWLQPSWEFC